MEKLVECVPNFSEGRDLAKVQAIVDAAKAVPGVVVLDVETDKDHHRSVLSFVAPPEAALEAAFRAAKKASELIDLNVHKGEHPRMGAVDVIPFIPVQAVSMPECVALAERLAGRIGSELGIPAYLYDEAARREDRRNLANVRKGQFEAIKEELGRLPERDPEFGPKKIHATAGAVAVGARRQIINFNVNLKTQDMELGKRVAKAVRTSGGGLPALRAKEILLAEKGLVQISTVLTDYEQTSMNAVLQAVLKESGCELDSTEIVGLIPRPALKQYIGQSLKLINFNADVQILEDRLAKLADTWQAAARKVVAALAEPAATPGGGSASALSAAMACGLGRMAAGISQRGLKKKAETDPAAKARCERLAALDGRFAALAERLQAGMEADSAAFDEVMAAYKLPKDDPRRAGLIEAALRGASEVPMAAAQDALEALKLTEDLGRDAAPTVGSDVKVARALLRAAIEGALENVEINIRSMTDQDYIQRASARMSEILSAGMAAK